MSFGKLPIDSELVKLCDAGNIERYDNEIVTGPGESLLKELSAEVK